MSYTSVTEQGNMVFDDHRNGVYEEAIKRAVTPDSVVLDLGAGLGLHAFLAARHGARQVYLVEPENIIHRASEVLSQTPQSSKFSYLQGSIEDLDLPEPVDVIISVFTGNFLLLEDLLPSLFSARDRFLKADGILVPHAAKMHAALISHPDAYGNLVDKWATADLCLDLTPVRKYAANELHMTTNQGSVMLSKPVSFNSLDFYKADRADCNAEFSLTADLAGVCHGLMGWFSISLADQQLSTGPADPQTHWHPLLLPIETPITVEPGDTVSVQLNRPQFGDWTWTLAHKGQIQRQSTFRNLKITPAQLLRRDNNHAPVANHRAGALSTILSLIDGQHSTAEILEAVTRQHGKHFKDETQLRDFVHHALDSYTR